MIQSELQAKLVEPSRNDLVRVKSGNRLGQFSAKRKDVTDSVTIQDATATDVQVMLNQHVHVSFMIRDGEESKAFKDLVQVYLAPAMLAEARFVDRIVLGQYHRFVTSGNMYGGLGQLTGSNGRPYILGTRQIMNQNKAFNFLSALAA